VNLPRQSTKESRPARATARLRLRLAAIQIGANLAGASLCSTYFIFVEPVTFITDLNQQLILVALMTLGLVLFGVWSTQRWQRSILAAGRILAGGKKPGPDLLAKAQRDTLNAPLAYSLISMGIWGVAAVIMTVHSLRLLPPEMALSQELAFGFRTFMGILVSGLATASIVFFATDRFFRRLRPLFFPDGGLLKVKDVFRLPLKRRLMFSFFMVGLGPMILLSMMVYRIATYTMVRDPSLGIESLVNVIFYLLAASAIVALVLPKLVAKSISEPAGALEAAIAKVEAGDLSVRVPVGDNDELGVLSDSFNQMTAGLAERERIKDAFGRFVTPAIAQAILDNPPEPGGTSTEVTVLFSDIRGYTSLSERLSPPQVIELLNTYFSHMVPAIEENQGLVYQFVGDAIMAVFGAPLKLEDHATKAVAAGQGMLAALATFNRHSRQGQPPLAMGIGIHSGPVVAGIIGSRQRMEYRVVGDTVNLASRVEGLNKPLGSELLISQATVQRLSRPFDLTDLGSHQVKGKAEPVHVFGVAA
jgi:adenylate cyclase